METHLDALVVKAGSSLLIEEAPGGGEQLNARSFNAIGRQVCALMDAGTQIVVVSSGAIGAGVLVTGATERPDKSILENMPKLQRLATIGWRHIEHKWQENIPDRFVGGMLLTRQELQHTHERTSALRVAREMLEHGDVLVVNENDAIADDEIKFGDNDTLAAMLTMRMKKSGLFGKRIGMIALTDVDGLYALYPDKDSIIRVVTNVEDVTKYAQTNGSKHGTGEMDTKLAAASMLVRSGVDMWLANGHEENVIARAIKGEVGTHFVPQPTMQKR